MNLSHLDWPSILVTALFASLGAIGGMAIKQWFDRSLEEKKVHWERASWVHQRQVEALMRLFKSLYAARESFQAFTRGRGEPLETRYSEDMESARAVFIESKLLFPTNVVETCDGVFKKVREAQLAVLNSAAFRVVGDANRSADELKNALEIAHTQIPELLNEIESAAREIIDGETRISARR